MSLELILDDMDLVWFGEWVADYRLPVASECDRGNQKIIVQPEKQIIRTFEETGPN
jgi:hypothetical protein